MHDVDTELQLHFSSVDEQFKKREEMIMSYQFWFLAARTYTSNESQMQHFIHATDAVIDVCMSVTWV